MPRIKIKSSDSKDPRKKSGLLAILSNNDIYVTKLIPVSDGYVIITSNDEDLDKVFQQKTTSELNENDFYPLIPPELRAKRSVIVFNVDPHIFNNEEQEIQDELQEHNEWVKNNLSSIYKFPNSKTLKITFSQAATALKALDTGLKMFQMSIPKHRIQQEKFYQLQTCFRCYAIEDHHTNACPLDKDYKVCSECADQDHSWKDCKNTKKKCINCKGDHRTLSMTCPMRKTAIKEKREMNKNTNTYAGAAKNTASTQSFSAHTNIDKDLHLKIYSCMLHAHIMNISEPGCFEAELNATFTANNLPTIKIPRTPKSDLLIKKLTEEEEKTVTDTEITIKRTQDGNNKKQDTYQETGTIEKPKSKNRLHSGDIKLHIYTSESTRWPPHLSPTDLVKNIRENKFKFTYSDQSFEDSEILHLIEFNEIKMEESCWCIVEDSVFRKIRSGQINDKSPLPKDLRRHRKFSK